MNNWIIPAIFPVVGVGLMLVGLGMCWSRWRFLQKAVQTTATVVDYRIERENTDLRQPRRRPPLYHAIVEFDDTRHVKRRAEILVGRAMHFAKGHEVAVQFDPDNPSRAYIDSFFFMWMYPLGLFAIGAVFLAAGLGLVLILQPGTPHPPAAK